MDTFDLELRVGSVGQAIDGDQRRVVHVDAVTAMEHIRFTWWDLDRPDLPSTVQLEVEGCSDGSSRLVVTETLLGDAAQIGLDTSHGPADHRAVDSDLGDAVIQWEVRMLSLWACTVAMALVQ